MFNPNKPYLIVVMITMSVCFLSGCIHNQSAEKFESAWQENDSIYVKEFIKSLEDETPEEVGAIGQVILSEYSNFGYGLMFYPRREGVINFWDTIPEPQQAIIKENIIAVWLTYVDSDLFLKKECAGMIEQSGEIKTFHEVFYPKRATVFDKKELFQIKTEMNKVASNCN